MLHIGPTLAQHQNDHVFWNYNYAIKTFFLNFINLLTFSFIPAFAMTTKIGKKQDGLIWRNQIVGIHSQTSVTKWGPVILE
jgi:hypothetical protein